MDPVPWLDDEEQQVWRAFAELVNGSLSWLSHVVTRLERRGAVVRRPCPGDARAILAVLTDEGRATVVAAAPGHVRTVRAAVFDRLDREDVAALRRLCTALLAGVDRAAGG